MAFQFAGVPESGRHQDGLPGRTARESGRPVPVRSGAAAGPGAARNASNAAIKRSWAYSGVVVRQHTLQLVLVAARGIDGCLCGIQCLHAVLQELFAGLGQGQVAGTAQQQGHAQLLLQPLQVEADHRAAEAEAISRSGELPASTTARKISKRLRLTMAPLSKWI